MVSGQGSVVRDCALRCGLGAGHLARLGLFDGAPYPYRLGGCPPSPISAKKPFVFSGMQSLRRRSSLILRELTCRYLCTKELRVFLNGSGDA